ncbi:MRG domain-containing protein [Ditylenchus destructor]|uniref:MRG domain-containing protein n=1 Tax=Ditylenchus destructor TaxID=166010 RepID=A0AAD4MXV9_9BILA|nr:MRG domain-containing protein [Ditylenchus destructor]
MIKKSSRQFDFCIKLDLSFSLLRIVSLISVMKRKTQQMYSAQQEPQSATNPKGQSTRITRLELPCDLREILHVEKKFVRDFYLSSVPARVTVREILLEFLESFASRSVSDRTFCRKFLDLFDSSIEKIIVDLERPMFHNFLLGKDCYCGHKQEKPEYLEHRVIRTEKDGSIRASSVFGLVHLLRFLRDIHQFFKIQNWTDDYTKNFMERTKKLVEFLHKWDGYFDPKEDVYPVSIKYSMLVMKNTP